jgi:DNA-binding transcriptional LysR family regulator
MPTPVMQLSRVRFDELAVFVEVAAAGSLTAAAQRLGVPNSTVDRAVARMEPVLPMRSWGRARE